ncbi:MAG: FHA domain-containing protein [Kofleriaceae bacterium]|nr:FHA domain-containing protein [Kofleriaceae bacterium]
MGRGPSQIGRAPAHLTVLPGGASGLGSGLDDLEEDRTTIEPEPPAADDEAPTPIAAASTTMDEPWEDGTTVAESGEKRAAAVDEPTVEDQARPLPPLQLVPGTATNATDPRALARLHVLGGSDQGRVFELRPGKDLLVGRAVDNDVCLTDIAVSRRHLELTWDGDAWVLRDRGSGNGTLINDRLEDGRCQLRDGDRIEIGNTVFRFDHPPSATRPTVTGWNQDDEEAATVAGRATGRTPSTPPPVDPRGRASSVTAAAASRQPPPPGPRARAGLADAGGAAHGHRPRVPSPAPAAPSRRGRGSGRRARGAVMPGPIPGGLALGAGGDAGLSGGGGGDVAADAGAPPRRQRPAGHDHGPGRAAGLPGLSVRHRARPRAAEAPPRGHRRRPRGRPDRRRRHARWWRGAPAATTPAPVAAGAATGDEERDPTARPPSASPPRRGLPRTAETAGAKTPPSSSPAAGPRRRRAPPPTPPSRAPPTPAVVEPRRHPPAVVEPRRRPRRRRATRRQEAAAAGRRQAAAGRRLEPPPAVVKKPPVRVDNDDLLASKKPPATRGANHEKKADGLYRNKDWKSAAALLREQAAATEDAGEARRLRAMAADYETIGANLATGATPGQGQAGRRAGRLQEGADRRPPRRRRPPARHPREHLQGRPGRRCRLHGQAELPDGQDRRR